DTLGLLPAHDPQVGAADGVRLDLEQDLARTRLGVGELGELRLAGALEREAAHRLPPTYVLWIDAAAELARIHRGDGCSGRAVDDVEQLLRDPDRVLGGPHVAAEDQA